MRYRATIERKTERREFVYMYREELLTLFKSRNKGEIKKFVEEVAGPMIGYKSSTHYWSIYFTLRTAYIRLFNIKHWNQV